MSLIQQSQVSQRAATYFSIPQEDCTEADDLRARIAVAVEAFSEGRLYTRYLGEHGVIRTITRAEEIGPLMRKGLGLRIAGEKLCLGPIGLLGGSPLDELEKKLENKPTDQRSVFISYQWAQKDLARDIEKEFEKKGFLVIRDESNLSQGVYLPGFMRMINHRNLDYVLVVVSDSYLKSKNCMYEVNQMMNRYDFSDTLLPFVMTDDSNTKADIYNGVSKYLVHWQAKLAEAQVAKDVADEEAIQNIIKNCKTFADIVRTRINVAEADLKKQRYQPFFDLIKEHRKKKGGGVSKEIDELLLKSARLEKIQDIKEAEVCYFAALKKIKDVLHLDGIDPICARLYGAYSEFLKRQNRVEEARKNLEIAKKFGYQEDPVAVAAAVAAEKANLLGAVEKDPSKFMEVVQVLKSEEELKALVNAFAFGKDKWEKYFGSIDETPISKSIWEVFFGSTGEVPSLPDNIVEILCSDDPYKTDSARKKVAETHVLVLVPTTLEGEKLTLKSLRASIKVPQAGHKSSYRYYLEALDHEIDATSPQSSQWVLMRKDLMSASSGGKLYKKQRGRVAGKSQYEDLDPLSGSVGVLTHYVRTGELLFVFDPFA